MARIRRPKPKADIVTNPAHIPKLATVARKGGIVKVPGKTLARLRWIRNKQWSMEKVILWRRDRIRFIGKRTRYTVMKRTAPHRTAKIMTPKRIVEMLAQMVVREARSLSVQTRSCAMQPAPQANIAMALQVIMEALRKRHASGDSAPTPTS